MAFYKQKSEMVLEAIVHSAIGRKTHMKIGMITIISEISGSEFLGQTNKMRNLIGKSEDKVKAGLNSIIST